MRTIAFSEYSPPRTFLWFLLVLSLPDVGGGQERGYTGEGMCILCVLVREDATSMPVAVLLAHFVLTSF